MTGFFVFKICDTNVLQNRDRIGEAVDLTFTVGCRQPDGNTTHPCRFFPVFENLSQHKRFFFSKSISITAVR